jgi:hypothetical protein
MVPMIEPISRAATVYGQQRKNRYLAHEQPVGYHCDPAHQTSEIVEEWVIATITDRRGRTVRGALVAMSGRGKRPLMVPRFGGHLC